MKDRRRLFLFVLLALLIALSSQTENDLFKADENENDDGDDYEDEGADGEENDDADIVYVNHHQQTLERTLVDFSALSLSGDPSIAAREVIQTLSEEILQQGRLQELFSKATTPECRALIAKHFGYHVMALAKEEPLPFHSTQFTSTCEDEQPWDFNNLPSGVHMGVSIA
jgi:hypothetical protein